MGVSVFVCFTNLAMLAKYGWCFIADSDALFYNSSKLKTDLMRIFIQLIWGLTPAAFGMASLVLK